MQFHKYDVVIVGAGGAGMRAAIEAGQRSRTAVLTKLYPTRSHTGAAQGGMCAALANVEEDNWEWHTFDTVKGGDYLADQDAAEIMAKEAIDAVLDLEKMGLPFNRTPEGKIDQRRFGGHTRDHGKAAVRRACYAADRTGHMILQTLYQNCVKHGIEFFNEFYVLDICLSDTPDGPKCHRRRRLRAGHRRDPRLPGQVHRVRHRRLRQGLQDHLERAHADRRRHGHRASARACRWRTWSSTSSTRPAWPGLGILLTEGARGEGGDPAQRRRRAVHGAVRADDQGPGAARHRRPVDGARGAAKAAAPGRTRTTCCWTAPTSAPRCWRPSCRTSPSSPAPISASTRSTEPVPVYPTAHYAMGGIPTNIHGEALRDNNNVIPGLYAAGEVACVSVHGANRLGTNSLLDINVFGRRAGIAAAEYAAGADHVDLPENPAHLVEGMVEHLRAAHGGERVADIRTELQQTMDSNAAVYRTEDTLKQALTDVQALKERYGRIAVQDKGKRFNTDLLEAIELGFLLDLAEVAGGRPRWPARNPAAGTPARTTRTGTT